MDARKLAKVLAMAASDNEVEAVHALRMARRLLGAQGVDFVEVARRVAQGGPSPAEAGSAQARCEDLEDALFDLRNEIRHLRAENERLRQGRGTPPAAPEPVSLAEAARDAATAIRLRAELARSQDEMADLHAEILGLRAHQANLTEALDAQRAEAHRLARRVQELDGRRMRLEAENRRLATAGNALAAQLDAVRAAAVTDQMPRPGAPQAARRGKARAKPAARGGQQYALL